MKRSVRNILFFGLGFAVLFCSASVDGGTTQLNWLNTDRFMEMPWGATLDRAQSVYPDLFFVRYAITDEKERPVKVYERKNEALRIDDIRVDGIRYWFRNNAFYRVTIHLKSKVGPRTITTPAAEAFDKLSGRICGAMGEPAETRIDHGISGTNRKVIWLRGEMSITLSYLEPPGLNDDDLILEILKGVSGTGTQVPE